MLITSPHPGGESGRNRGQDRDVEMRSVIRNWVWQHENEPCDKEMSPETRRQAWEQENQDGDKYNTIMLEKEDLQ